MTKYNIALAISLDIFAKDEDDAKQKVMDLSSEELLENICDWQFEEE